jgi:hypothetical protein
VNRHLFLAPLALAGVLMLSGCAALGLVPEQAEPFRGCSVTVYNIGQQFVGMLDEHDCAIAGGRRIEYFEMRLQSSQRVAVRVGSDEFDTYLYLFDRAGNEIARNDDITPFLNTDSRVVETLDAGRYIIGVSSASSTGAGRFSLTSELR